MDSVANNVFAFHLYFRVLSWVSWQNRLCLYSVATKKVPRINLLYHIRQILTPAVGHNHLNTLGLDALPPLAAHHGQGNPERERTEVQRLSKAS
mgnify:CR=1 FL=1